MKILVVILICIAFTSAQQNQCKQDPVVQSPAIPGGLVNIKVDDNIKSFASQAATKWNSKYNTLPSIYKVVCVRNAQSQVVSGIIYRINATLSETNCPRTNNAPVTQAQISSCQLKTNGKNLNCVFRFWVQPWLNNYSLVEKPKCT